jgi:hypothetical protein
MPIDRGEELPSRTIICPHCDAAAYAAVRGTAVWDGCDDDGESVNDPHEWVLLQCSRCQQPCVQLRCDYGTGFERPVVIYPAPRILGAAVPQSLRREFEEAETCFRANAYEATVVMVGRVLEGACKENNVNESTLANGLTKLQEAGLIDSTLAQWANELRVLRNQGAHYTGKPVPRDDTDDALAFAEALLEHVYILRKRFEEFTRRRTSEG